MTAEKHLYLFTSGSYILDYKYMLEAEVEAARRRMMAEIGRNVDVAPVKQANINPKVVVISEASRTLALRAFEAIKRITDDVNIEAIADNGIVALTETDT